MLVLLRRSTHLIPVLALLPMLALVSLTPVVSATATESPDTGTHDPASTDQLDEFVRDRMDANGAPGVAYAIVGPSGITHSATFGTDGDGEPIDASTPFQWGSVAKPMTATVVMSLVRDGDIWLDEPVTTYLPSFRFSDEAASDKITIRHLLAQTGGIPESMDLTDHFDGDREPADVLPELADRELEAEPGEEHIYSSVNYQVLAAVIEKVTGRPFVEVLNERVLDRAGMDSTITDQRKAERVPPGHRYVFGSLKPFDSPYDPAGTAYGYVGGTLEDAAAFVQANLGESDTLLPSKRRESMYRGEITTGEDQTYGLGWRRWQVDGTDSPMVWHAGATPGYFTSMVMLPEKDRGIVVLQNAYGSFQENEMLQVSLGLAQMMYGVEADSTGTDPIYWWLIAGFGLIAVLLAVIIAQSIRRVAHPRARGEGERPRTLPAALRLAAWAAALGVVISCFSVTLPDYFGVRLGQFRLWAPDLAWLVYAIIAMAVALIALRVAVTTRALWQWRDTSLRSAKSM